MDLKEIILKSREYLEYPKFVTDILVTTVSERRQKEVERQKHIEQEEQQS